MSAGVLPSAAHVPLMRQQQQTFMQRCTFNFLSQTGDNFDAALDGSGKLDTGIYQQSRVLTRGLCRVRGLVLPLFFRENYNFHF